MTTTTSVAAGLKLTLAFFAIASLLVLAVAYWRHQEPPAGEAWRAYFPETMPMKVGETLVRASVADTEKEKKRGLSGTPDLPEGVVKLFVFEADGAHPIWMKDMLYPIDILWVNAAGTVVHIEPNVVPETFPTVFSSPVPARYVIETAAGFAARHDIAVGAEVTLPQKW
jgi:uncharacterized membrane protein (UPF0127 family)/cbb3-type cytochrome oxidase subunit 3